MNNSIARIATPVSPVVAYCAAPVLVAAVGGLLWYVQTEISTIDGRYSAPDSIAFLLPIILVTLVGGRGPGVVCLALSGLTCAWFLMPPRLTIAIESRSDTVNLVFMLAFGAMGIAAIDIIRWAARTQARLTEEISAANKRAERIATAFQNDLLPEIPAQLGRLMLAYYYKPALDESLVGGDFVDVFRNAGGEIVVVVGDVSGKGLAAATQVGTILGIIRFALHGGGDPDLGLSIRRINEAMVAQQLISGFATMFIAIVNAQEQTLCYVSCGHEPGFLIQANSSHEAGHGQSIVDLVATGPVIGAFDVEGFGTSRRVFCPGDALVVYTDGFSEAGPSRSEMLGSEGIKGLLNHATPQQAAPEIADLIISGTKTHSGGQMLDDACLLVCRLSEA